MDESRERHSRTSALQPSLSIPTFWGRRRPAGRGGRCARGPKAMGLSQGHARGVVVRAQSSECKVAHESTIMRAFQRIGSPATQTCNISSIQTYAKLFLKLRLPTLCFTLCLGMSHSMCSRLSIKAAASNSKTSGPLEPEC